LRLILVRILRELEVRRMDEVDRDLVASRAQTSKSAGPL
jgi:hypothetical protein